MAYKHAAVSVTSASPALICSVGAENDGVIIQNAGSVTAYLGGAGVAASGATMGIQLAAGASVMVPTVGNANELYAITATSSTTLVYLFPEGA